MTDIIARLTPDQRSRLAEFVERWEPIGLSTAPSNRAMAEEGARLAYCAACVPMPRILWYGSPSEMLRALEQLTEKDVTAVDFQDVRDKIVLAMRASVRRRMRIWVEDTAFHGITDVLEPRLFEIWGGVWRAAAATARHGVRWCVEPVIQGQHRAPILAAYDFFCEVLGLGDEGRGIEALRLLARSTSWALLHARFCCLVGRPSVLAWDERRRLHSLAGAAVRYPDGWSVHAIHGVRVEADVIERPENITTERIESEGNAEVRRILIERFGGGQERGGGAAAYLRASGAERIDHDERFGTLWRKAIAGDEPLVMVEVVNATREADGSFKRYFLRVPPTVTTAREAVAWSFGKATDEYRPEIES